MFGIGTVIGKIEPCTKALFYKEIDSKIISEKCALIRRLVEKLDSTTDEKGRKWCETRISEAKRTLPVITPMAYFKNNKRKVANAIPSGLNMLDIDHVDDPLTLWENIKDKLDMSIVGCVHRTPSTHGLRIVFRQPDGKTIEEAQAELAEKLGVVYDGVTKDLARCSFLVERDYFIYINDEILFSNGQKKAEAQTCESSEECDNKVDEKSDDCAKVQAEPSPVFKHTSFPSTFKSVPYSEIIEMLLAHTGYDTTPTAGERNNALYTLARNLRYCCDFDVDFIISTLPDWGLGDAEVRRTVESAVKSVRMATMPKVIKETIEKAQHRHEVNDSELFETPFSCNVKEEGLIGEFVKLQPDYLKNAAYLTAMTCFGTLLTRLRGYGPDGSVLAPNFMLTVSAPQASGKSFMKRIAQQILAPIEEEDDRQRKRMKEIERENRRNKDKEGYEEQEFDGAIRILPSNTSNRILLERMDKAKGQHCIIIAEEIDSITKAEKQGKWSEKSDIYRLAYDNSKWGQDYASENSYHAVVPLYLNLMFSGTPAAVNRFFNDIENGLITRFLFIDLPDTYGQKRPIIKRMDEDTTKWIKEKIHVLWERMQNVGTEDGLFWLDTTQMVKDAAELYDEVQRREYLLNQDDVSRDLARRRYCNYVVEMMMVETYLNDGVYTEDIRDRVLAIMNLCTEQLIASYGDEINKSLNESVEKHEEALRRTKKEKVLDHLPMVFTNREFEEAMCEIGGKKSSCPTYLTRMVNGGLIIRENVGVYRKI